MPDPYFLGKCPRIFSLETSPRFVLREAAFSTKEELRLSGNSGRAVSRAFLCFSQKVARNNLVRVRNLIDCLEGSLAGNNVPFVGIFWGTWLLVLGQRNTE
ncbi:hypothetical protein AVEN_169160-1 [Araneus ventricosus]|uniref:Uncharacterized protein n=1 Tax=Araneus ventricosus TaxID=182803 RepID=A0A4Y2LBB5_ARAVE|nr:hypothetical protein AVEN_169160-1 [Araneus ventricosus]